MGDNSFSDEDKQRFIEFLNMTATKAKLELTTAEIVTYFKLLAHMQQKIIPKIEANILEIKKVIEPKDSNTNT